MVGNKTIIVTIIIFNLHNDNKQYYRYEKYDHNSNYQAHTQEYSHWLR